MSGAVGNEALMLVRKLWAAMTKGTGFERTLQQIVITSAGQGSCTAKFTVEEGMTNSQGGLHGGCTATIIDCISTLGQLTSNNPSPGVSVNLSINYLKGAKVGETIIIDSKTLKAGKNLAFLETVLKKEGTETIVATGQHIKYIGN